MGKEFHLTRSELYELVWSEPMVLAARKHGLSDVGLAKICRRMRVPTPWRGYWARKEAGEALHRTPLPKLAASAPSSMLEVTVGKRANSSPAAAIEGTGPIADQRRFEAMSENRISVASVLSDPHPLVAESIRLLRRAKASEGGYVRPAKLSRCLAVDVTLDSVDRSMCIFDALIKALDHRGFVTRIDTTREHSQTIVRVNDEEIPVLIEEKVNRVDIDTGKKAGRDYVWNHSHEWVPTGSLSLRMDSYSWDGARQTWSDGKKQRIEDCLNNFVVGLVVMAEEQRVRRLEQEERQRQWKESEDRRLTAQRRRAEESARAQKIRRQTENWIEARNIRAYVAAARELAQNSNSISANSFHADWLAWASAYANRIDPLLKQTPVTADSIAEDGENITSETPDYVRYPGMLAAPPEQLNELT